MNSWSRFVQGIGGVWLIAVLCLPASADGALQEPAYELEPLPDREVVTIVVVDGASGTPVEGAWVMSLMEEFQWSALEPGPTVMGCSSGLEGQTDGQGRVEMPRGYYVIASADGCYAKARVGVTSAEVRLELTPSVSVVVDVVDSEGRPAVGVGVSLCLESPFVFGRTDARGRVLFGPLQMLWGRPGACVARIEAPFKELLEQPVPSLFDGPTAVVRFQLPPSAPLRIEVVDHQGRPAHANVSTKKLDVPFTGGAWSGYLFAPVPAPAIYPHVGLHLTIGGHVSTDLVTEGFEGRLGPVAEGEERLVQVCLPEAQRVVADVIDLEPALALGGDVQMRVRGASLEGGFVLPVSQVACDEEGAVTGRLSERVVEAVKAGHNLEVFVVGVGGEVLLRGASPLRRITDQELRTVVPMELAKAPRLAAGCVQDQSGAPVAGVRVEVHGQDRDMGDFGLYFSPSVPIGWAVTGEDGRFEVGGVGKGTLRARVVRGASPESRYFGDGEERSFQPGDEEVQLVLPRLGFIAGQVHGDVDTLAQLRVESFQNTLRIPHLELPLTAGSYHPALVRIDTNRWVQHAYGRVVVQPGVITRVPAVTIPSPPQVRLQLELPKGGHLLEGVCFVAQAVPPMGSTDRVRDSSGLTSAKLRRQAPPHEWEGQPGQALPLFVPAPGQVQLMVSIRALAQVAEGARRPRRRDVQRRVSTHPSVIEVGTGPGVQTFKVVVDAESLRWAIEELSDR